MKMTFKQFNNVIKEQFNLFLIVLEVGLESLFMSKELRNFAFVLNYVTFCFVCENLFNFNNEKYLVSKQKYDEKFDAAALCYGVMVRDI